MQNILAIALVITCGLPWAIADEPAKGKVEERGKVIASYLDDQTVAVAYCDWSRFNAADTATQFNRLLNVELYHYDEKHIYRKIDAIASKAGVKDIYWFMSLADFAETPGFIIIPVDASVNSESIIELLSGKIEGVPACFPRGVCEKVDNVIFAGSKKARQGLAGRKPSARLEVGKAMAATGDMATQILIVPSADSRRAINETLPTLPKEFGGGPVATITEGIQWAALGMDYSPKMKLRLVIQSKDTDSAKRLNEWIASVYQLIGKDKELREALPMFEQLTKMITPEVKGDQLVLALDETQLGKALQPAAERVRSAQQRMVSTNNLKQIGLAMHGYHDIHNTFPAAASYGKDGKPLLSWRVHILPLLEQDKLYKEFHLDEPWDSEHNKKLIVKMPQIYQAHAKLAEGKTTYVGILGNDTMFPGKKAVPIKEVIDGSSNTIFVVEAADDRAVIWTKPEDLTLDASKPAAGLGFRPEGVVMVLFVDGSVRAINKKIDPATLNALYTRNGGEVVGKIP
jgi:hypothetical protein